MSEKKVEIVFSEGESHEGYQSKGGGPGGIMEGFVASIDDIAQWFGKYNVDSIELWIQGGVETGGILKLFVSAKGEGGMKVTLKPKN